MNLNAKNQPGDVDSVTQTRFLVSVARLAPACALLGWVTGGLQGILYAIPGSVVAASAVELLSGRLGSGSVNVLYGMGRNHRMPRDQLVGTLTRARVHKMNKCHDKALTCIEEVLDADPNFPEALFVKAQILWDGFQDGPAAKLCLINLMKAEPDKEAIFHRWAVSLYKEIATSQRKQNAVG